MIKFKHNQSVIFSPQFPTKNIKIFHDNDVLCGRGGLSQNHIGNKEYRAVINANKRAYVMSDRKAKTIIVNSIVRAVREQEIPGRFLEYDRENECWNDIGDKRACAKVS